MYYQYMQEHLDNRQEVKGFTKLTQEQIDTIGRSPLPIFVQGIKQDGPTNPLEYLALAGSLKV